jgi:FKBP-type peptidyl-prolyl cis-trans isomerase
MNLRLTAYSLAMALCVLPASAQDAPPAAIPAPTPAPAAPDSPDLLPPAQEVPVEVPDGFASEKERQSYAVGWLFALREKTGASSTGSEVPVSDDVIAGLNDVLSSGKSLDYAVGAMLALQIRRAGVEVDAATLSAAVKDALSGAPSKLTPQQQNLVIQRVQNDVRARGEAKQKEEVARALQAGNEFLAENARAEGVQTTASGLQYKVEKQGDGKAPGEADIVTMNYTARLLDGTEIEKPAPSGPTRRPFRALPKGLQEGLTLLKTGGKAKFWIPPSLGYGESGRPPFIKGNAVLVYEVECLAAEPLPKPPAGAGANAVPRAPITAVTPPITVEIPPKPADKPAEPEKAPVPPPAVPEKK